MGLAETTVYYLQICQQENKELKIENKVLKILLCSLALTIGVLGVFILINVKEW